MKPRHASSATQTAPVESAKRVGLRYVSDKQPGLRRVKVGTGFRYVNSTGKAVRETRTLQRIRSLAIPPAWTDVWICASDKGHLQATGRDARGRKQHRYHPLWREVRDATKYDRMIEFAEVLPGSRRRIAREMAKPGLHREKVFATIIRLMDLTLIRVGNEEYARQNGSFGLTTLQDKHARIHRERIHFSFRGKSGKSHTISVEDRRLARIVKHCQDIPGQDLFQFLDASGKPRDVTSGDVNEYLRQLTGTDFTAKDFRTWAGTVLAARALSATKEFKTQAQAKRHIKEAIEFVAAQLGNTTAVCRKCYVHPSILNGYMENRLPCKTRVTRGNGKLATTICSRPKASLGLDEREVLQYLRCCRREEDRTARAARTKLAAIPRAWQPRLLRGRKAGHR